MGRLVQGLRLADGQLAAAAPPNGPTEPNRHWGRAACPPRYVGTRAVESPASLDTATTEGWKAGEHSQPGPAASGCPKVARARVGCPCIAELRRIGLLSALEGVWARHTALWTGRWTRSQSPGLWKKTSVGSNARQSTSFDLSSQLHGRSDWGYSKTLNQLPST